MLTILYIKKLGKWKAKDRSEDWGQEKFGKYTRSQYVDIYIGRGWNFLMPVNNLLNNHKWILIILYKGINK